MKKVILSTVMAMLTVFGLGGVAMLAPSDGAWAAADSGLEQIKTYGEETVGGNETELMPIVKTVINVIIGIVGIIAVAMMIIGGISYSTSQGDAAKVKKAKDTILYGVIGLVVALLAFAIVNFVLTSVFNK